MELIEGIGPKQMAGVLKKIFLAGEPILIKSSPGCGKSDIVGQVTKEIEFDLQISHPVVDEPTDYKGIPFVVDGQAMFLPYGQLSNLLTAKKPLVAFLDDLGQAPPVVQAACMQLLLAREINGKAISKHVRFVAASNLKGDRAGVGGMLEPVKSRFISIIGLVPNVDDWCQWANTHNMPSEVIAYIRYRPNLLHSFEPTSDLQNSPCPRTIANLGRLVKMGFNADVEAQMYAGAVGQGFATEFLGFLQIYRDLPDPDLALAAPDAVIVPKDAATLYAFSGGLSHKVTKKTMAAMVIICGKMDPEFSVLTIKAAVQRDDSLKETQGFIKWAMANQDVLI